jgi:4,5:9,10-diseco-3-hydroxy-5,9,17-trioxoandrosta-1(10),2-diene-4-oate hydrolase
VNVSVEAKSVEVDGLPVRYLAAGEGPPLVLLHGAGDNSLDWRWVLPALARMHRVYAPDLPGSPDSARPPADYSSAFFERFVAAFVDALGVGRATFVGNSLGGLIALRLALSEPARVGALVLVDSAGLGRAINPAFTSVNVPGPFEAAMPFWRTPLGAHQRAWGRTALLFAHPPGSVPREWLAEQRRLALRPGYLEAHLTALRALVGPFGQREVLLDRLPLLEVPTLVVWGERDRVFPERQAREAIVRLREGSLAVIPNCGHMPHVECPDRFLVDLDEFLVGLMNR